jgi:hypothetical protein
VGLGRGTAPFERVRDAACVARHRKPSRRLTKSGRPCHQPPALD